MSPGDIQLRVEKRGYPGVLPQVMENNGFLV